MKHTPSAQPARRHTLVRRLLPWLVAALVLPLVFASYLRPDFVLGLANRFILCL